MIVRRAWILLITHEIQSVRDRQKEGLENIPRSFQKNLELKQNKNKNTQLKLGSPNIARELTLLDRGHDSLYDLRWVCQGLTPPKEHARISAIRRCFHMLK